MFAKDPKVGDRVRFKGYKTPNPYSKLEPGTEGTVKLIVRDYPSQPVHVLWDGDGLVGHRWDEVEKA